MSEISGWKTSKMSELCHLGRGRVINAQEIDEHPGIYPVYSSQSKDNGIMGSIETYDFEGEYVTWTTDGAYAGTVFYREGRFNCTNVCGTLEAKNQNELDINFLAYKLSTVAKNHVSYVGNPKLMNGIMAGIEICLPINKPEQSKIAEVLSKVYQAIEQTESLIAKQQRIKTGLMQDLLTRGIDEHGNLRSEETHEFKDSPLGRIPVEWEVKEIDELACHVGSGITPTGGESVYSKEGVLFIRSQNVYFDGLHLSDAAFISDEIHRTMKRSEIFKNDVLLNITGASIGRCCRMSKWNGPVNVNQHVCAIRLTDCDEYRATFLSTVLSSAIGQNQIAQFNAGGNREGLNYQQVRAFKIPWPKDLNEFERIEKTLSREREVVSNTVASFVKLRSLKTALMQDLLTGKVRVTPLMKNMEAID